MTYLLGTDIGTSSVKTVLLQVESGHALVDVTREYPISQPRPGWAQQNPDDWWNATVATIREAITRTNIDPNAVRGISLCGQMHGFVPVDGKGQPLAPAIIWADTRSSPQVDALNARVPLAEMARYAPGPPAAGFMGSTLMWLSEHQPDLLAQTAAVLLPKDYVRLRMTDAIATEPSDAAATWLFDVHTGDWSDALIDFCGVERRYLPEIVPSTSVAGTLTLDAAQALGLPAGIPVVAGCADQPAQSLGYGLYKPGFALATIATGGQFVMPIAAPQTDAQMRFHVFNHAVPNIWYAQGATLCAGLSLRWLRDILGFADRPDAYEHLSTLAAAVPAGADGLLFLPYLAGERTPLMDAEASGVFVGLRIHHTAGHLARAVMEGVAFSMKQCLDLVFSTTTDNMGADVDVIASGGAARSAVWRQIQADVYNRSLLLSVGANHAPVGAALLAGVGAGVYGSFDEACSLLPQPTERITPDAARAAFYAQRSAIFDNMYALLKDDMHRLARAVPPA